MARNMADAHRLVSILPVPALLVGAGREVLAASEAAAELLGTAPLGRHYMTLLRQPELVALIEAGLEAGRPGQGRHARRRGGGRQIFRVAVTPEPASGAVLVLFEDITASEAARRMRSDFVANLSHELRSPLAALLGFIETLQGPAADDPAARARFLEIMGREAGRMNRLVEDLLSLSRVEDLAHRRPEGRVELIGLIREQVAALEPQARARRVRVVLEGAPEALEIPGDGDQLRQVFANLIDNAIKYGAENDRVLIAVTPPATAPARGDGQGAAEPEDRWEDGRMAGRSVTVAIRDRGPGIDARHLGRLTERFYRVDSHRSRDLGGTGLGLAIVKHILARHDARLRIESRPGQGSSFSVCLPAG